MQIRILQSIRLIGLALLVLLVLPRSASAVDPIVDAPMYADPKLTLPEPVLNLPDDRHPLWLKALARPEVDLQRQSADAITKLHRLGKKGLRKECEAPLRRALLAKGSHTLARRAVARCLVALEAKSSAEALFKILSDEGLAYAQIVEPALAQWDYKPIRSVWLSRLADKTTRSGLMRLAITGLAQVNEPRAADLLWNIAGDASRSPQLRLAAARSLARIKTSGLTDRAKRLAADRSPRGLVNRLIAATLLVHHKDVSAQTLLVDLINDPQPSVAAIALQRLLRLDPGRVVPSAARLLKSRDSKVRDLASRALIERVSVAHIKLLSSTLDDRHPGVRSNVRTAFIRFAKQTAFKKTVIAESMRVLQQPGWRGQEQAAFVLGALIHKPAAARLVKLLASKRPEVMTAAAWALRKVEVRSTLPAMLRQATRQTESMQRNEDQLAQLHQAFGTMNYAPAVPLLMRFIPKDSFPDQLRGAAIWSLGKINQPNRRDELIRLLTARLSDESILMPESIVARRFAAISLSRIGSKRIVGTLRKYFKSEGPNSLLGLSCRWGIQTITGEKLPGPEVPKKNVGGWFLEPVQTKRP